MITREDKKVRPVRVDPLAFDDQDLGTAVYEELTYDPPVHLGAFAFDDPQAEEDDQ